MNRIVFGLELLVLTGLSSTPTLAGTLYDNGGTNVPNNTWYIGGAGEVSDSFTLAQSSTVQAFSFGLWVWSSELANYTDGTRTVNWSITSSPNGGTSFGSGSGVGLSGSLVFSNPGAVLYQEPISTGDISLAAGTYYLNLGGVTNSSGSVDTYWNESDGPSTAFLKSGSAETEITSGVASTFGSCATPGTSGDCSQQFTISGLANTSSVPEPGTWLLTGAALTLLVVRSLISVNGGAVRVQWSCFR